MFEELTSPIVPQIQTLPTALIELTGITKKFRSLIAVDSIDLTIFEGEVLGILGPNGAGKTTLFKLIAGILSPDNGRLSAVRGKWPRAGYKPERLLFPNHLRVRRYLRLVAAITILDGHKAEQAVENVLNLVGLSASASKRIRECSKGMRQRLGFAQALLGDPELLLLDEPSNGLDPEGQSEICLLIKSRHAKGKTILLASHQLHEVTEVCTRLIILNHGRILYVNDMDAALIEKPHTEIVVNASLDQMKMVLLALHEDIRVEGNRVILENEAVGKRREVLSAVLNAGFDISSVSQNRVSLAEIYAEAVR